MRELIVLVVDDDQDQADSLALLVRMEGHRAFVAYTALAGLRLASEIGPDIVIHDLGLPDMPGMEALHYLRHHPAVRQATLIVHSGTDPPSTGHALKRSVVTNL